MQEIIQWLNSKSNEKYSNLRLLEVDYDKDFNIATFKFHFLGETFCDENRNELKTLLNEFLQDSCEINLKIKPYFFDRRVFKTLIVEYIKKFYNGVFILFEEENLIIYKNDNKLCATINCNASQFKYLNDRDFIRDIQNYFNEILFDEFEINLNLVEQEDYDSVTKEEKYKLIKPEPFISLKQDNIFDVAASVNDYLKNNTFVVFDLETTGLIYNDDDITEIGAVKIVGGRITETFTTLLKPSKKIPQEVIEKTGITNEMVQDAPLFENVVQDFYNFCDGSILVGYNILEFDIRFLNFQANKCGFNFDNPIQDALVLAKKYCLGLKHYKLKDVSAHLNVVLENAHRALFDTLATAGVFMKLSNYLVESN